MPIVHSWKISISMESKSQTWKGSTYLYVTWVQAPCQFPCHHMRWPPPLLPLLPPFAPCHTMWLTSQTTQNSAGEPAPWCPGLSAWIGMLNCLLHILFSDSFHALLMSLQSFSGTISRPGDHLILPSGTLGTVCNDEPAYHTPACQAVSRLPPPRLGQCFSPPAFCGQL